MAQVAYPTNPSMNLFLALAYTIKGDRAHARKCYEKAALYSQTHYWRDRFESFGLIEVMNDFPSEPQEVFETIETLGRRCSEPAYATRQ